MKTHDVQSVELETSARKAFEFISAPENLPRWTSAFKRADSRSALLVTPQGELPIGLRVDSDPAAGSVDWHMTMPDGTVGSAYSRVVPDGAGRCIYAFVLTAPPVPLEKLEGALEEQKKTLREELERLRRLLR